MNTKTILRPVAILSTTLLIAFVSTGCVTKSEADARARIAFLEGQNQILMRQQGTQQSPTQMAEPGVSLLGAVRNPTVPWRTGLMLTQAIVGAQYLGNNDPSAIVIHRNGQDIPINPKGLLNGEDFVLQIGDVIEIRP